jgi:hypothetical protein
MSATWRTMSVAVCLLTTLVVANMAQAQSRPATTAKAPAAQGAPVQPTDGPDALFARWDTNHDKVLSPEEFRAGWQALQTEMTLHRLHEQFVAMDTDKNGCLNAAEYARLELIRKAGTTAPPLSMFDTEKNQCLDFKEYVNAVNYLLKHKHK